MKKFLVILIIALVPSLTVAASATVGGTLKIYWTLAAEKVDDMIFPAQFVGTTSAVLVNSLNAVPASGIPQTAGNMGKPGQVMFNGSGGSVISISPVTSTVTLTNSPNASATIPNVAISVHGANTFDATTTPITTATLSGTFGTYGAVNVFIRGLIPIQSTPLTAGTYTGSIGINGAY
ncbi:MAG: hypothetical protein WCQ47_03350 [bacterium]